MKKVAVRFGKLEAFAFVSGFALMAFELAGARILAPGIGSSIYVWTSVIGVIIAALSVGYWLGGKLADSRGYAIDVARLSLVSGFLIACTMVWYSGVIDWASQNIVDPRLQGVIASLLLFAPASLALGMISPYLAKLKVRSLSSTGRSIAGLSAMNAIGSISGTFVTGFILFGYIGAHETLAITAVTMVAISWLLIPRVQWKLRLGVSLATLVVVGFSTPVSNVVAIDTPTSHYNVLESDGVRWLVTGPRGAQSGVDPEKPDELAYWYAQKMASLVEHVLNHDDILVLGGGAFVIPRYLADKYPDSNIDVVEIDPRLAEIAREYFFYDDPPNVNLIFQDARTFVNQTNRTYDVILIDVYGDIEVPFTFMSREYGRQIERITASDGVVAANVIANTTGACKETLNAMDAPYRAYFDFARYDIQDEDDRSTNMILAYSRQPFVFDGSRPLVLKGEPLFNDNFVPAERLQYDCLYSNL